VSDHRDALEAWQSGQNSAASSGHVMPEAFRMTPAFKKPPEHTAALERVREWTRTRFRLDETAAIMVAEIACAVPGCPPLETAIAFWTEGDRRHHFKVFKPAIEVTEDDLPPAWMKDALIALDGVDCDCC
jgi:nitrate reductase delta subunit